MIELGRLGLGAAELAGLYEPIAEDAALAIVDRAWELGIRYFDSAPYYGSGLSELRLGQGLRTRPRDRLIVSTKVGRLLRPDASGWDGAYFDFSYDGALRSLEGSLARLGFDRVDIALVHDPDDHYAEALSGAFTALARLRDEGVLRAIGVGMNQTELLCRFAREADPDCLLVAGRYTVLDRTASDALLPLCEERGIAVIAGGVFNSGILAGGDTFDYEAAPPEVVARVDRLREVCARWDVPLPAAAVQFSARHPAVCSTLVGCRSVTELEEDVRLFGLELPDGLWDELA